jgi:hypothetical protein
MENFKGLPKGSKGKGKSHNSKGKGKCYGYVDDWHVSDNYNNSKGKGKQTFGKQGKLYGYVY